MTKDYVDTTTLQEESLINFAAAIGYEALFDTKARLLRFKQPKFRKQGVEYRSVRSMIKIHNEAAEDVFRHLATVNTDFQSFINTDEGLDMVTLLFAGTVKIIETVKGQYKRGVGFFVDDSKSNHMIKFNTDRDAAHYQHYLLME